MSRSTYVFAALALALSLFLAKSLSAPTVVTADEPSAEPAAAVIDHRHELRLPSPDGLPIVRADLS
jgi:hypothetical protein